MRPYLAILYDSLREAMYSRVLWILLALIVIVLLALAPFTVTYPRTGQFFGDDIRDIRNLASALVEAEQQIATPQRSVWDHLEEKLQSQLIELSEADEPDRQVRFRVTRQLLKQLNTALGDAELFTPAQLGVLQLNQEGRELREASSTVEEDLRRLNRLAVEAVFPDQFKSRSAKVAQLKYAIWPLGDPIPFSKQRVHDVIDLILVGFINFFVGLVGVLVGILVTASIVPNTFDAGSINLLLSTPISRPLLYLTKVFGGCWFVLINATLLVVGLWLLVGVRLGVWNERLLWSIPLFLFIFLVYYSVSAFAGLVWRNTIVSVVVTVIFWFTCFLVGTAHDTIENLIIAPQRFSKVLAAGDDTFAITQSGTVQRWDAEETKWTPAFNGEMDDDGPAFARRDRLLGPVYDQQQERLVAIDRRRGQSALVEGRRDTDFERDQVDRAPSSCRAITINAANEILVADDESISRIKARPTTEIKDVKLFGMKIPLGPKRGSFESLGPRGGMPELSRRAIATFDISNDALVIFEEGKLWRWELQDGRYRPAGELTLEGDYESVQALIAAGGGVLAIALDDGTILLRNSSTLAEISQHQPFTDTVPRQVAIRRDGTTAVLFHNGHLWTHATDPAHPLPLPRKDKLTSVSVSADGQLLLADKRRVVYRSHPTDDDTSQALRPRQSVLERVQRYIIAPLYTVFPKPGKLKETNAYLLTKPSAILEMAGAGLDEPQPQLDPWTPVWSSGAFAIAMLLLGCVYISRQDF